MMEKSTPTPKVLILRFSSLGDIAQAMDIPTALKRWNPHAQVQWAVREDFQAILQTHPDIDFIWSIQRQSGISGLFQLIRSLRRQEFTHIYDAHNNLRSHILTFFLHAPHFLRRPKNRWKRWLLFRFRINYLPTPFQGRLSFLTPLKKWGVKVEPQIVPLALGNSSSEYKKPYVTLAPSAAWPMKRWPISHWKTLISSHPEKQFVILGGPEDEFLKELVSPNGKVVAGTLSLLESLRVVAESQALISNDTGLLHYADLMGVPSVALIGPTAFGYPSGPKALVAEIQLVCKPCSKDGRDPCRNPEYQKCLKDLSPAMVDAQFLKALTLSSTREH